MALARTVPASKIIEQCRYELRDQAATNYSNDELLGYLNRCNELIYEILVDKKSELIQTGTSKLVTNDRDQNYNLFNWDMGFCGYNAENYFFLKV